MAAREKVATADIRRLKATLLFFFADLGEPLHIRPSIALLVHPRALELTLSYLLVSFDASLFTSASAPASAYSG